MGAGLTRRREASLRFRFMVVERLRLLKKFYSYSELARRTSTPETVLCRYVKGDVLPGEDTAKKLWEAMDKIEQFPQVICEKISIDPYGYVDTTGIVSDPLILMRASHYVMMKFAGRRITKILTPAVNGVPIATSIAMLLEVPIVIAKRYKEMGVRDYIEESYPSRPYMATLYVPKNAITARDDVLIVDDLVRTGSTIQALVNIVRKLKANVSGVFTLISIDDECLKNLRSQYSFPIETVASIQIQPLYERSEVYP
ncbi:MAG: phosphoribosyltransferase family protein [Candidatus Nezhaarchaeota archaeon]|nr:phosphoribosyltransferase family protein [Candidatus Nezhaarchaeota archaeon]MCX8142242.1 phosphoribosyltransferase family protein [Candidatus Nezhaarchaeota archaeon]MDW8050785.1 phosphoribosyltransferase family protein [Nitrososphaerota archaeon]